MGSSTNISKKGISREILAGITVGVIALPLSLAFGVSSGLGAAAGLYGAIGLGLMAAIFGGTRTQISGPTGPMTIVCATVAASYSNRPEIIFTIFMLAGLFQILFGFLKLGKFIKYVPYPVISGFMSGIGLIIMSQQLFPFIGHESPAGVINIFKQFPSALRELNISAIMIALVTIAIIYIVPKFTKLIPATLIALIVMTVITVALNLNVPLIGDIPKGLPNINFPVLTFSLLPSMIAPALTLAALGSIDSLLTSLVADKMSKEKHDSNKELVGQGIGNFLVGIIGGIPGAGATMRTVANIHAGGKTRISGAVHALFLLFIVLVLGPYASFIPKSVLAGILITVGIGIIDYQGIRDFKIIPRHEMFITIIVGLLTLFTDLLLAVAIGIIISKVFLVVFLNKDINKYLKHNETIIKINNKENLLVQKYRGPLFFGMSNSFHDQMVAKIQGSNPKISQVIFDMADVSYSDQSGLYSLISICTDFNSYNVDKVYVVPPADFKETLKSKINDQHLTEYVHIFDTYEEAYNLASKQKGVNNV